MDCHSPAPSGAFWIGRYIVFIVFVPFLAVMPRFRKQNTVQEQSLHGVPGQEQNRPLQRSLLPRQAKKGILSLRCGHGPLCRWYSTCADTGELPLSRVAAVLFSDDIV